MSFSPDAPMNTMSTVRRPLFDRQFLAGLAGGFQSAPSGGFFGGLFQGLSGSLRGIQMYQAGTHEEERQRMMDMIAERRMRLEEARLEEQRAYHQGTLRLKASQPTADYTVQVLGPTESGSAARALPPYLQGLSPAEIPMAAKAHAQSLFKKPPATDAADSVMAASLDEPTLRMAALGYAKTMQLPPFGMGKVGAEARAKILNYASHNFPALDVAANKADFQKNMKAVSGLQSLYDQSTAFAETAKRNADVLMQTMSGIPDIPLRFGNRVGRWMAAQAGSPDVAKFHAALETLTPEFTRILQTAGAPTGSPITDSQKKDMQSVLGGDFTAAQLKGSLGVLFKDAENKRRAYSNQIDAVRARLAWNLYGANPNVNVAGQQNLEPQPGVGVSGSVVAPFTVTAPNGKIYSFPNQASAEAFKREAGIR